MKTKKSVLFLGILMLALLPINVFAQSYYYGQSALSNVISSTLDMIFGGIVGPIIDAIGFAYFGIAIKLALWIILFILFSWGFTKVFGETPKGKKFSKVIGAILAIFSVVFTPDRVLEILFRDFLGGLVGLALFASFMIFPLWGLYKWSKDSEEKAVNLVCAGGFFLMMMFITYLDQEVVSAFNYGVMQNIASLCVMFGVISSLILFIHRLVKGFKGSGQETPERAERREQVQEEDLGELKGLAREAASQCNEIREHIGQASNRADHLAFELVSKPKMLDFITQTNLHGIYSKIVRLNGMLKTVKGKQKSKARGLIAPIAAEDQKLESSIRAFVQLKRSLGSYLSKCRKIKSTNTFNTWINNPAQSDILNFFKGIEASLHTIDRDLEDLAHALLRIEGL